MGMYDFFHVSIICFLFKIIMYVETLIVVDIP